MAMRQWVGLSGVGLLMWCTGCATLPTRAEIPLGKWSGTGTYIVEKWSAENQDPNDWKLQERGRGSYPTRLDIESVTIAGRDAVRLEILSERGVIKSHPDLGDRTHLVLHLRKVDSQDEGAAALYQVIERGLSTSDESPQMEKGPEEVSLATCNMLDGDIVLRILYGDGWVDVFHFQGNRVYKNGAYFQFADGYVQWSEVLRRRR